MRLLSFFEYFPSNKFSNVLWILVIVFNVKLPKSQHSGQFKVLSSIAVS